MRATRKAEGIDIPRLGSHGEKRAGIRVPRFQALDPAVQEELAGGDFVYLSTLHNAIALLESDTAEALKARPSRRRNGLKEAA
jgi:hypothetical protein